MGKPQAKKALKYMLHSDGVTAGRDSGGHFHTARIYKRITPKKDLCINRENPHRKLPNSSALVVGFDGKGDFQNVIKDGLTHGYWTLSRSLTTPEDHGGSAGDYVARTLIEFDLNDSGITNWGGSDSNRNSAGRASAEINIISTTAAAVDTETITLINTAGLSKTYKYMNGGGKSTGDLDGGSCVVQVNGESTAAGLADELRTAILHTGGNGHAGTIGVTRDTAKLTLQQATEGRNGNTNVSKSAADSKMTKTNFTGGRNADTLLNATFSFFIYKSKTIVGDDTYYFDFHRMHPGLTGNTGAAFNSPFTEQATWYEYNHSGTGLSGPGHGEGGGPTGSRGFLTTDGTTHGNNRWEFQGLGWTGSTAEHSGYYPGATGWYDYSGGVSGSNQIELYSDNIYTVGFTADKSTPIAGTEVKINFKAAVQDAISNYDNKLRFMIKLRNDHTLNGSNKIAFLSIQSSEQESNPSEISAEQPNKPQYSPSLHIEYLR